MKEGMSVSEPVIEVEVDGVIWVCFDGDLGGKLNIVDGVEEVFSGYIFYHKLINIKMMA